MRFRDTTLIREGGRNRVLRAWMEEAIGEERRSVVVKELRSDQAPALWRLDWACLQYVAEVAPGVAPRVLAGDEATRSFVMEDLGGSRTLDDVLREGPAAAVFAVCIDMARQTARLQAATLGQAQERRLLAACGTVRGAAPHDRAAEAERWLAGLARVREWLSEAGVSQAASGFDEATARAAERYRDPGEWLAFTHGDPAPSNTHVSAAPDADGLRVRLMDFEYGGFRHALYDVTAWWMLCPLPPALEQEVRQAYRQELAGALSAARDEATFTREWALLAAYRGLAIISWLPLSVLREDHEAVPGWSARARLMATATRLREATTGVSGLEPLVESAQRLEEGLGRLWPEQRGVLPVWSGLEASGGAGVVTGSPRTA